MSQFGDTLGALGRAIGSGNYGNIYADIASGKAQRQQQADALAAKNATYRYMMANGAPEELLQLFRANPTMGGKVFTQWLNSKNAQAKPMTDFGKAQADLNAGYLTQEQYQQLTQPKAAERPMAKDSNGILRYVDNGQPVFDQTQNREAARQQQAQEQALKSQAANIVVQDIDRIKGMTNDGGLPTTGLAGEALSWVPGTDAHNVAKLLDTVKANAGFDKLQAMRDASPTGGALGQVSNQEITLLTSAIGSLEQSQSKQQFIDNLNRVRNIYAYIIDRSNSQPISTSFEEKPAVPSTPETPYIPYQEYFK